MAPPLLTCPACGRSGPADRSEAAFKYVRRDGLLALRVCEGCGAGLLVRFTLFPADAEAEVVPPEVWRAVEESGEE